MYNVHRILWDTKSVALDKTMNSSVHTDKLHYSSRVTNVISWTSFQYSHLDHHRIQVWKMIPS